MSKLTEAIYFVEKIIRGKHKVKKLSAIYKIVSQVILTQEIDTKDMREFIEKDMEHAIIKKLMTEVFEHMLGGVEVESFMGMKVFVTSVISEQDKIMVVHPEEYVKMLRRYRNESE